MSCSKIVLAHDWLNGMRGGEKCLEVLCELFPSSPLYTLFYEPGKVSSVISSRTIHASGLQRMPKVYSHYRYYLPLFASFAKNLKIEDCDLVVSTSHCVAKSMTIPPRAKHICYCFTPVRYAWGFFDEYFGGRGVISKALIRSTVESLKKRDIETAARVDHFVAISNFVKQRIKAAYNRDAEVIYPPVDTEFYAPDYQVPREDFYLVTSALVPYKRIDLAVEAFNQNKKKLVVIGEGPDKAKLQKMAQGNIQFLGWQSDEVLRQYYRKAKALVFPGEEDFGIVPLEAQSCGLGVIAYGSGGALETIIDGKTGCFFQSQNVTSLQRAIEHYENLKIISEELRHHALLFSRVRYIQQMSAMIKRVTNLT